MLIVLETGIRPICETFWRKYGYLRHGRLDDAGASKHSEDGQLRASSGATHALREDSCENTYLNYLSESQ